MARAHRRCKRILRGARACDERPPTSQSGSMKGRTGFRHDFIFVILTELPGAITQTRGPYTCLKELQAGIPKSIGSLGLRFCCGKFCKNDGD